MKSIQNMTGECWIKKQDKGGRNHLEESEKRKNGTVVLRQREFLVKKVTMRCSLLAVQTTEQQRLFTRGVT